MNEMCKNCGAWWGLHHYETNQCPLNGVEEIREGHKQQYASTIFEPENTVASLPIVISDLNVVEFSSSLYDKWTLKIDGREIMTKDLFMLAIQDIIKPLNFKQCNSKKRPGRNQSYG
jgi:hypothetical protein